MFWNKSQPSLEKALCVNPLRFTPRSYLVRVEKFAQFMGGGRRDSQFFFSSRVLLNNVLNAMRSNVLK